MSQGHPGGQRGEFLVLPPGRPDVTSHLGELRVKLVLGQTQLRGGAGEQFALLYLRYGEAAGPGGCSQCFAEKLAFGGVDHGMRSQDRSKRGQRPAGGEEQAAAGDSVIHAAQIFYEGAQFASGERGRATRALADDPPGVGQFCFRGGMVRLSHASSGSIQHADAPALDGYGRLQRPADSYGSRPSGMRPETDRRAICHR